MAFFDEWGLEEGGGVRGGEGEERRGGEELQALRISYLVYRIHSRKPVDRYYRLLSQGTVNSVRTE